MPETWQIVANIRLEGKITTPFRETAINEAESIIRGAFSKLDWLQLIEPEITATRRIFR